MSEKPWNELSQPEVDHFYPLIAKRAEQYGEMAHSARLEFSKYLVAANTGAAAGLFFSKSQGDPRYLVPFYLFCGGAFAVGVGFLLFANWSHSLAEGFAFDARSGISVKQLEERTRKRWISWKFRWTRHLLVCSFLLLMAGGCITAKLFWSKSPQAMATPQQHQ